MRSENELKEDCGTAAYYYLEDKVALKGESKARGRGIAHDIE